LLARNHQLMVTSRARLVGSGVLALGLASLGYLLGVSFDAIKQLPAASGLVGGIGTLAANFVATLLMFNVTGDENYRHNLAGEPMLNVFVGLMLIAGILVGISRLHERRYRLAFTFLIVLLIPALITNVGVPNAARAAAALPLVVVFAAIGVSYMLELWYATFPINSAARVTGQAAIIVLIMLTGFQGYAQYFRAWAGSSEVYVAYNEGAVEMSKALLIDADNDTAKKRSAQRYVVAPADQASVIAYLDYGRAAYQAIGASDLVNLPVAAGTREFLIAAISRDDATKVLKSKFPGGILRPHYSSFNQAEIYYSYEVTK